MNNVKYNAKHKDKTDDKTDDNTFIKDLLAESDKKWKHSYTAAEIKEEMKEAVAEFYEPYLNFEENKENMETTIKKLDDYVYIHDDEPVFPGRFIRYLDHKFHRNLRLSRGEIVLKYENDMVLLKRFWKIFRVKRCNVRIFMKLNKTDKFRAFLNEFGNNYVD